MTNYKYHYRQQNHAALQQLLQWAGSPAELARIAGVNRSTVTYWESQGKISREGAIAIAKFPGSPLTAAEIRSDIKVWK
jgi:hypothetical protein